MANNSEFHEREAQLEDHRLAGERQYGLDLEHRYYGELGRFFPNDGITRVDTAQFERMAAFFGIPEESQDQVWRLINEAVFKICQEVGNVSKSAPKVPTESYSPSVTLERRVKMLKADDKAEERASIQALLSIGELD